MYGNPTCLQWILNKWAEQNVDLEIDVLDHNGYTPLYQVCYRGYLGAQGVAGNSPEVKLKRIECVQILLAAGANINYMTPKLRMTPLHWAAYQGDAAMVQLLLENDAIQHMTTQGSTPVDIAGFMGHKDIVVTFCKDLEKRIMIENKVRMENAAGGGMSENGADVIENEAIVDKPAKLTQVSPGQPALESPPSEQKTSRQLLLEMGDALERTSEEEGAKLIIDCKKVKRQQLDHSETIDMHCFYWAAFYGLNKYLRYMVLSRRWSPFIKSF